MAITLHEAGHGYAAHMLGDDTAKQQGRVTLNPLAHIDLFGTIILPGLLLLTSAGFLFGYAKPVPVDYRNLHHPKRDMMWVALAGPGTNIALALVSVLLLPFIGYLPGASAPWAAANLNAMVQFNILLAVFNMLPIPPLDGGRVAVGLLPRAQAMALAKLERAGIFLVIGAFFLLPMLLRPLGIHMDLFRVLVLAPTNFLYNLFIGFIA